jgi:hypothetical protein
MINLKTVAYSFMSILLLHVNLLNAGHPTPEVIRKLRKQHERARTTEKAVMVNVDANAQKKAATKQVPPTPVMRQRQVTAALHSHSSQNAHDMAQPYELEAPASIPENIMLLLNEFAQTPASNQPSAEYITKYLEGKKLTYSEVALLCTLSSENGLEQLYEGACLLLMHMVPSSAPTPQTHAYTTLQEENVAMMQALYPLLQQSFQGASAEELVTEIAKLNLTPDELEEMHLAALESDLGSLANAISIVAQSLPGN